MAKKPVKKAKQKAQEVDGRTGAAKTFGSVARKLSSKPAFKQAVDHKPSAKRLINHVNKNNSAKTAGLLKGAIKQTRKQQGGTSSEQLMKSLSKDFNTTRTKQKNGEALITLDSAKKRVKEKARKGQKETKGRR